MKKQVILFDLGNTLVGYMTREEFPGVLRQSIDAIRDYLRDNSLLTIAQEEIWPRVEAENKTSPDFKVIPIEEKLCRIFRLNEQDVELMDELSRLFLKPVYARTRLYPESLEVLDNLRSQGFRLGIVSNLPWGSPQKHWHDEVARHGLSQRVEHVVFCRDAGWRKPARQVFDLVMERFGVGPEECLFIGDDPRWDIVGPEAIGMDCILIDRENMHPNQTARTIHSLLEILK